MTYLIPLAGLVAALWSILALIAAIFPGNRRRRLKHSGVAFAVFFGLVLLDPTPEPERNSIGQETPAPVAGASAPPAPAQPVADTPSEQTVPASDPAQEKRARAAAEYAERLSAEIEILKAFKAREFTDQARTILIAVEVLNAFAVSWQDGAGLELSSEQRAERGRFKTLLSQKQREALPILRDAYGPAMRKALWEADGKAKTFGAGYRTVEFINAAFAANRNIKKIHEDMYPTLMRLRFTRVQYKWVDAAVEYQYYTLEPPKDEALAIWRPNGTFTLLD